MSIASEITRLQGVKSDILTAIADKGVTVPADSMLDDCPDLIASISTGDELKPLPAGFKEVLYLETAGSSSYAPGFTLNENSAKTNKMSDKIKFTLYMPALDLSQTGTRRMNVLQRGFWEVQPAFAFNFELGLTNMYVTLRGYGQNTSYPEWNDGNSPNYGYPEFSNVKLSRDTTTGKFKDYINGTEYILGGNSPITDDQSCNIQLFNIETAERTFFKGIRIFKILIYDGFTDKLKQHYTPVLDTGTNMPGFYEQVNGYFVHPSDYRGLIAGPYME